MPMAASIEQTDQAVPEPPVTTEPSSNPQPDPPPTEDPPLPEPVKSARSHTARFDALPFDEQIGLAGEYEVNLAVDQYKTAQELFPGELVLLEEEAELLERFEQLRRQAQQEGKSEGMPVELARELARLRAEIDGFRRIQLEAARAAQAEAAQQAAQMAREVAKAQEQIQAQANDRGQTTPPAPERKRWSRRQTNAAILGSGLVTALGGAALVGGGVWTLRTAIDRRDEQLEALATGDYQDEPGSEDRLNEWYATGQGIAAGLLTAGVVLTMTGIGLTTWSTLRSTDEDDAKSRPRPPAKTDTIILGSSLVTIMGGAALIGGGIQSIRTVELRRDARQSALDANTYLDEQRLRDELEQWSRQRRGLAVGLLTAGVVLTGAGVGLTTWGVLRVRRRHRAADRRSTAVMPMISSRHLGLSAAIAF